MTSDKVLIERLRVAVSGKSFVQRKYGAGILRQIRYLEQRVGSTDDETGGAE